MSLFENNDGRKHITNHKHFNLSFLHRSYIYSPNPFYIPRKMCIHFKQIDRQEICAISICHAILILYNNLYT